ncbi:hypothetical protein FRC07_015152 [Ceratobasidium sp. 392]|nr:hypothetical protein FRC07_015152 [Ceratobasidium sp. 392]
MTLCLAKANSLPGESPGAGTSGTLAEATSTDDTNHHVEENEDSSDTTVSAVKSNKPSTACPPANSVTEYQPALETGKEEGER